MALRHPIYARIDGRRGADISFIWKGKDKPPLRAPRYLPTGAAARVAAPRFPAAGNLTTLPDAHAHARFPGAP